MPINEEAFFKTLRPRLIHKELGKSLLPFRDGEQPSQDEMDEFLQSLLFDIRTKRYLPTVPRGYIVQNKGNYIPRISPVLSYRDMCVYYFCVTELQEALSAHRVPGTFGGWLLGNPMRAHEKDEQITHEEQEQIANQSPYSFAYALNPFKWMKNWRDFQQLAYQKSRSSTFGAFIEFDIANFYDTVNLELLERKIREQCGPLNSSVVDLLFTLLKQWNRQYQGYNEKTVGLPQEESADCSRILANFYLQTYDASMAFICRDKYRRAEYLRYADDQIIMAETLEEARQILVDAERNLHEIGLNISAGKVREFSSVEDFDYYWTFELMDWLGDKSDVGKINLAARKFIDQRIADQDDRIARPWRWWSVEKRILKVGLSRVEEPVRTDIARRLLTKQAVESMDFFMLSAVARGLTEEERLTFFRIIDDCIPQVPFNSFHLNLRRFFVNYDKPWRDISEIDARIDELNTIWDPSGVVSLGRKRSTPDK